MFFLLGKCSILLTVAVILLHLAEGSRIHPQAMISEPELTEIRNLVSNVVFMKFGGNTHPFTSLFFKCQLCVNVNGQGVN